MSKFTNDGLTGHRMLYSCSLVATVGVDGLKVAKDWSDVWTCRGREGVIIRRRYTKKLERQKKIYHRNEQLDDTSVDRKHLDGLYSSVRPIDLLNSTAVRCEVPYTCTCYNGMM